MRLHRAGAGLVDEGAMLDRIDARIGRGHDAARAVGMGRDLEMQ